MTCITPFWIYWDILTMVKTSMSPCGTGWCFSLAATRSISNCNMLLIPSWISVFHRCTAVDVISWKKDKYNKNLHMCTVQTENSFLPDAIQSTARTVTQGTDVSYKQSKIDYLSYTPWQLKSFLSWEKANFLHKLKWTALQCQPTMHMISFQSK